MKRKQGVARIVDPMVITLLLAWVALLSHASLLQAGRWQADDYIMSGLASSAGLAGFIDRMVGWSPRPVAELINYAYFSLSNALDRPLIGTFLAALWGGSGLWLALCARIAGARRPLGLAALWFALALLMAKPGEMFFWPTGADVYLPCWAALAAASVLHCAPLRAGNIWLSATLLIAAFCSEVGALTVLIYAGLRVAGALVRRDLRPGIVALALPTLGAIGVCVTVQIHRVQVDREVMDAGSHLAGHWMSSAFASIPSFARELVGIQGMPFWLAALVKLSLLLSLGQVSGNATDRRLPRLLWAVALLLGVFVTMVLAYHQFGNLCCERHTTLRQTMIVLALAVLSTLLGHEAWRVRRWLLPCAMLVLAGYRIGPFLHDMSVRHQIIVMRQQNWQSGLSHDATMLMKIGPDTALLSSEALPAGVYHRHSRNAPGDTPWYAWGIMMRFDKDMLDISPVQERASR